MPHELKLEGSPGQPQITPLTVPGKQFAVVENLSSAPLQFIEHLNASASESIAPGDSKTFVSSVFLVSTGSTDIRLSFGDVSVEVSPDTAPEAVALSVPVEEPEPVVESVVEPVAEAPAPVAEPAVEPVAAPVAAPAPVQPASPIVQIAEDAIHAIENAVEHVVHPDEQAA